MKKLTQYERYYKKLMGIARREAKKGIQFVELEKPKTYTQLKASGAKAADIRRETRKIKKVIAGIAKQKTVNVKTGELGTLEEQRAIVRKERKKEKELLAEQELRFYSGEAPLELPQEGEIAFDNVYNDFILKMSQGQQEQSKFGNHRSRHMMSIGQDSQNALKTLADEMVQQYGKNEVGRRIQEAGLNDEVEYILWGSSLAGINAATIAIANALTAGDINKSELVGLNANSEYNETGW